MIFTAPVDGLYQIDGGTLDMKKGEQVVIPDNMPVFRLVGNSAGKSQLPGPSVSEGIVEGHNA